jgi:UDP-2,4-diacetamido-2,4,6-trideoxy-beta-L-altropyranose hydrolase
VRVVLHADASPSTGTGHVMRCLALGAALRADGVDVTLAADEIVEPLVARARALGIPVVPRDDAERDPDWIVVDGYHLDATRRARLAEASARRVVVADGREPVDDATIVLNQNLYASAAGPSHAPSEGELLAGPSYALLHPEYAAAVPERPPPELAQRVLVTMGGADPADATSVALTAVAAIRPPLEARIVIGAAHPSSATIVGAAQANGVEPLVDVPSLAPHLAWSDLVVSASGSSVLEVARLGRAIVAVVLADNQRPVAAAIESERLGIVAGAHPGLEAHRLAAGVEGLRADASRRRRIAELGPRLVDGLGARRVAGILTGGVLELRRARMDDADRLLDWRNDPDTRAASFTSGPVDDAGHVAWLGQQLDEPEPPIWIGAIRGEPVGVIRFTIEGGVGTASVTVAPGHRGAGIGARLVTNGTARLLAGGAARVVDAWIKPDNASSIAAFERAGYRRAPSNLADRLRYRLEGATMG